MEATNSIRGWGEAMMTSLTGAMAVFMGAIPRIIGSLVILVVGWLIASLIAKGLAMFLRSMRFNELSQRSGISDFVQKAGVRTDSSGVLAGIAKWFIRLMALVVAFDALGLPAVSQVLRDFLMWLPNLVVALVVLVIGGLASRALANLVRATTAKAQLGDADVMAKVAGGAVWAFAIVVAVNQLGIAERLINALFTGFVGALALAVGLSFGLGGRDTAAEILRNWRERSRSSAQRLREAAGAAEQLGRERRAQIGDEPREPRDSDTVRREGADVSPTRR